MKWDIDKEIDRLSNRYYLEPGFVLKNFTARHPFMKEIGLEDDHNCQAAGHDIWSLRINPSYQGIDLIVYDRTIAGCFEKMGSKLKEYFKNAKESFHS